jgi:hypothetical protein
VTGIRGSDLYGQSSKDRVEFCTGPGSHVTAIHQDSKVGRKELDNLQCASVFPDRIDIRNISLDDYRLLTNSGPRGAQNNDHGTKSETKVASPPGNNNPGGPNNNNNNIGGGCLLCKTKIKGPTPPPGP